MYKSTPLSGIKHYRLDRALFATHKEKDKPSTFGLDNSSELIDGMFGLYSSSNIKPRVGPAKTEFFRFSLVRSGSVMMDLSLEQFQLRRNHILFGFPGQIFGLHDADSDFFCYYMLFTEEFIADAISAGSWGRFPFFTHDGIHSFELTETEALNIENIIGQMNGEVQECRRNTKEALQLYLRLILLHAHRAYERHEATSLGAENVPNLLYRKFIALVNERFLRERSITSYAEELCVTRDHLTRTVRQQSGKTPREFIEQMIVMEAKARLLHSTQSVTEIAYDLQFTDPSHFNKFFKKSTGATPQQYREEQLHSRMS